MVVLIVEVIHRVGVVVIRVARKVGAQPTREVAQIDNIAYYYAFQGISKVEAPDIVFTGTILICDRMASVLFDPKSTFSYASVKFALGWDLNCEMLDLPIYLSTLVGVFFCVNQVYSAFYVVFMDTKLS